MIIIWSVLVYPYVQKPSGLDALIMGQGLPVIRIAANIVISTSDVTPTGVHTEKRAYGVMTIASLYVTPLRALNQILHRGHGLRLL